MFGPYRALGVLGEGGMGVVYRAEHLQTGEVVAIKTARDGSNQAYLAAMRREIPALRRLCHPGIIRFIDNDESDGVPWVAMPLLRGRKLSDHLRELHPHQEDGTLADVSSTVHFSDRLQGATGQHLREACALPSSLTALLTLCHRLCAALAYLHGEGLVHRDLKPENVFLLEGDRPVLIDLGLALHFSGVGRDELDVERVVGSPPYMAPEQIRGDLIDARADLYALGCILFELTTGLRPFPGRDPRKQHLHDPPLPPSCLVPDIPRGLEDLILKLLEKRPEDRIGYAADVADALVALGATPSSEEGPPPRAYLYRPAFKGRSDALRVLQELAEETLQRKRLGIALVRGESGMGKTRLVRELTRRLPRECLVLMGSCTAPGAGEDGAAAPVAAPLDPLREALLELVRRAKQEGSEAARRFESRHRILVPYLPELQESSARSVGTASPSGGRARGGRPPSSVSPSERSRERVIAALRDALRSLAEPTPLVLLLDDLQWADELTLGLLKEIAREDNDEPESLLIVGTYRVEEPRDELDSLARAPKVTTIDLQKLDERSTEEIVAGMLANSRLPRPALDALLRSVGGNPFFAREFLLTAIDEGVLRRDENSRLVFDERASPSALTSRRLPSTLAALLNRRLDLLDAEAKRVAEWAAVLGDELDDELLLLGPCQENTARNALATLLSRRILEEASGRLSFVHSKLRETAYRRLNDLARRDWHVRAADVLRGRCGEDPSKAPLLAHHFAGAGLHARAGEHYTRAAQHAAAVYAFRDALRFYPLALHAFEGAGSAPPEPATFHEGFGDALRLIGKTDEARGSYAAALENATSPVARARLHRKAGRTWEMHHEHVAALECYARAESTLDETSERDAEWRDEWLEIQFDRTSVQYWQADVEALDSLLGAIRPVVEPQGAWMARARYLHALTQREILSRRFVASPKAIRLARECLEAVRQDTRTFDEDWGPIAQSSLGVTLLLHHDLDAAEQEMHDALAIAGKSGDLMTQIRCLAYLAVVQRKRGLVDRTASLSQRALKLSEEEGVHEYAGAALGNLAWCALQQNDLTQAEDASRRAVALWGKLKLVYPFQWLARLPLCRVEVERGRLPSAIAEAEVVLSGAQQRLPRSIESALASAVGAFKDGRRDAANRAVRLALQAARNSGHA